MKKLLLILITIPLIFGSCEKEDDSPNSGNNNTSGSILGTWKVENYTHTDIEGYIDPVLGTEVITNTSESSGPDDGEAEYMTFQDDTILTHTYNNDTLLYMEKYDYTKNGNEIIVHSFLILTITQLTNTNLSYTLLDPGGQIYLDTTFFYRKTGTGNLSRSTLPSRIIQPLNKKNPVSHYNSFLNRRKNK